MVQNERLDAMLALCETIPEGRVIGYAGLGSLVGTTGRIVGRWLSQHGQSTKWWRVVGSDGEIRTFKYNPEMGTDQERRLLDEGVRFLANGKVDPDCFCLPEELG